MIQTESPINMEVLNSIEMEDFKKLNPKSFPLWVFPKVIQDIVFDGNKSLSYPIDFLSASILFACGLANGLTTKLQVKKGWTESTLMYMAIVGRAGINKSHPLKFAMKPIEDHDDQTFAEYSAKLTDWEGTTGEKGQKPYWKKTLLMDATIEAICDSHSFNKRGLGVYSEELNGWFRNMGRYNNGSDMEQWLSIWTGSKIVIDRKGSRSINLPQTFVSVIGTIQNNILMDITTAKNSDNGFTDRVLFVIPENLNKEPWTDNSISDLSIENYKKILQFILQKETKLDDKNRIIPDIVPYTDEAYFIAKEWNKMNTDRCNGNKADRIVGVYSKMDIYLSRFALTLQIMFDAVERVSTNKVDTEAIKGAIEIVEYFIRQAEKIHIHFKKQTILDKNPRLKNFYDSLPEKFETKEAKEIGFELNLNEKAVTRYLSKGTVFLKLSHGNYQKININA